MQRYFIERLEGKVPVSVVKMRALDKLIATQIQKVEIELQMENIQLNMQIRKRLTIISPNPNTDCRHRYGRVISENKINNF
jgi:hypothetical protein